MTLSFEHRDYEGLVKLTGFGMQTRKPAPAHDPQTIVGHDQMATISGFQHVERPCTKDVLKITSSQVIFDLDKSDM